MYRLWRKSPPVSRFTKEFSAFHLVQELHGDHDSVLVKKLLESATIAKKKPPGYDNDQKGKKSDPLTLVIGGVTLGGSGKTQVVKYLAKRFLEHGCQNLFIIGHGYLSLGDKNATQPYIVDCTNDSGFEYYGDEAVMLASEFHFDSLTTRSKQRSLKKNVSSGIDTRNEVILEEKIKVLVGGSWSAKWRRAKELGAQVIICDGGLYTQSLIRHVGITALSSYDRLALFPWGRLCRPISSWATGSNYLLWGIEDDVQTFQTSIKLDIKTKLRPQRFVNLQSNKSLSYLPIGEGQAISVVCGIANAVRFKNTLLQLGYLINQWQQVQDHKAIPKRVIEKINNSPKQIWVTTMKDVPKFIMPPAHLWALEVGLGILNEDVTTGSL